MLANVPGQLFVHTMTSVAFYLGHGKLVSADLAVALTGHVYVSWNTNVYPENSVHSMYAAGNQKRNLHPPGEIVNAEFALVYRKPVKMLMDVWMQPMTGSQVLVHSLHGQWVTTRGDELQSVPRGVPGPLMFLPG